MHDTRSIACLLGLLLLAAGAASAGPVVHTTHGAIEGVAQPGLQMFLGIPYAEPPVGDLRWRAPQPVRSWDDVRPATRFAASCYQDEPKPFGPYSSAFLITPERSEDCLYLNVWAPADIASKRPVYFFIHGGAFQSGGASVPVYDGAALARKGVVVVTINYRLGIFGFLAHPELTRESPIGSSGNYGLLDMIEALRWVRANIERLGGDPANVTIAGQSAGAAAVSHLLLSPLAEGLFHRAVIESGPIIGIPLSALADAEKAGVAAAAKLNAKDIATLRTAKTADVAKIGSLATALPTRDGKVVISNPDQLDARITNKVPVIAGYNRDETVSALTPKTVAAFEQEVRKRFGSLADRVLAAYPHASDAEAARSAVRIARDRIIAALLLWAEQRTAQGQPVHAYLFEHVFPGHDPAQYGAFHTAEVPYILGTLSQSGATFTAEDQRISDEMQDRWIAFMRSGDPNPTGASAKWARASADPKSILRIGAVDTDVLITPERLAVFRAFAAEGGTLGLL